MGIVLCRNCVVTGPCNIGLAVCDIGIVKWQALQVIDFKTTLFNIYDF